MYRFFIFFLMALSLPLSSQLSAETVELEFTNEAPRLPPDIKPNIWYLPGDNSLALISTCKLPTAGLDQYWQPSYRQVTIIDKKVVALLKDQAIDWKDKNLRKLYFGLTNQSHQKQVYALIYREKKPDISSIIGYDELDCYRIEHIVRFDIDKMAISVVNRFGAN